MWQGGMHGSEVCMAGGGMCGRGACMAGRGCAWQVGGMHGEGHAWQGGACMACMVGGTCMAGGVHGVGHVWQILRDTVNERAVRILLECILVTFFLY